jgi:hypothetical protein
MIALLAAFILAAAQGTAPSPQACQASNSVRTTVAEIGRNHDRFLDRCVTVSGALIGIRIYDDRDGIYLTHRFGRDGNTPPTETHRSIGLDNQEIRNLQMRYPHEATITGRVDSCRRRSDRVVARGGIPFLGGYCHYSSGPTIIVDAWNITERSYERMTGENFRRRFGNIGFMPADWPSRPAVENLIAEFLQALRAGDRAKLSELHEARSSNEHDRSVLYALIEDRDSVFAQVRQMAAPQTAIFVHMAEDGSFLGREDTAISALACFCRSADCSDRWPISINDANNQAHRPYACTRIEPRDWTARKAAFNTPIRGSVLHEPARTAFRQPTR